MLAAPGRFGIDECTPEGLVVPIATVADLATNTIHEPFFAPSFKTLAAATQTAPEQLDLAIPSFLASEPVNERTDDDKTLVVAMLIA